MTTHDERVEHKSLLSTGVTARNQHDIRATASSHDQDGLSTAAKVGIGVGASLAVVLVLLAVAFWRKRQGNRESDASPQPHSDYNHAVAPSSERQPEAECTSRNPEQMTHPAYELNNPRLSTSPTLHGASYEQNKDDNPMYLAVPAHLSGQKRWSKALIEDES